MTDKFYIEKFENILFSDIKKRFQINNSQSYYRKLYEYYFQYNKLNDLQKFRSIPNYFKKIKHNWILIYEKKLFTKVLAGHAVMCEIIIMSKMICQKMDGLGQLLNLLRMTIKAKR